MSQHDANPYTNPTGPGYLGVWRAGRGRLVIAVGTFTHVDWTEETELWARDVHPDAVAIEALDRAPGDGIAQPTVNETHNGVEVSVRAPVVRYLNVDAGDDVRGYRRDEGGLYLVPKARDPFLDGELP